MMYPASMQQRNGKSVLGAYLSPLAIVALSFGYAVGWGAFVMPGTTFLPDAGPAGTIIGILVGVAAMGVFAFNYHRMLLRAPGPGGSYAFATKSFGPDHGFLIGWFLWLTYVAILWANATALVLLSRFLFGDALQFGFHYRMVGFDVYFGEVALCVLAILLCGGACLVRKRFAAALNTALAGVFLGAVVLCFLAALRRNGGNFAAMSPAFAPEGSPLAQVIRILAMIPWAFVGFEAVVNSSAEYRFPLRWTFRLLLAGLAVSTAIYLMLALLPVLSVPGGFKTWSEYLAALPGLDGLDTMPVFAAVRMALGRAGVAIIGVAMLCGQLTGLFGTFIAASRLMYAMAEGGTISGRFARLNSDGTPANAILFISVASCVIPFFGRTVTGWPVDVSNLGAVLSFGYTSAAVFSVASKEGGRRAFLEKTAGLVGLAMAVVFGLLMLVPNYISGETLSAESYLVLSAWCVCGFLQYRCVFRADRLNQFGRSTATWVGVLVLIFFSSLMWIRLAIGNASERAFFGLVGKTVDVSMVEALMRGVSLDMLLKAAVELALLIASLAIMLDLFSIQRGRETRLLQQKLAAEESANRSKSFFFSTVSHDIRTPLNAIVGFSQMLKLGCKTEAERVAAVDSVLVGSKSLLALVNDILELSRLESGEVEIARFPTDCRDLVRGVAESFRVGSGKPDIEIRDTVGDMPLLLVDPLRLRHVASNLVSNAVKFTEKGFVEIRASFAPAEDGKTGTLLLEVEDTGCGIREEDRVKILSPYERTASKLARNGGTGFGLAIGTRFVAAMGGTLTFQSEVGRGTTFRVSIPGVEVVHGAMAATVEAPVETRNGTPSSVVSRQTTREAASPMVAEPVAEVPRILLADDAKLNLTVLKTLLKSLGSFEIEMAANGQEALEKLQREGTPAFDAVLTDMWMPELDGEGLVRAIRANPRLATLPVHVVTADVELQETYAAKGFDGIILKPITVEALRALIAGSSLRRGAPS